MFSTTCIRCGEEDTLEVVSCNATFVGLPLTEDGFAFSDAKQVSTEDEMLRCTACNQFFLLADLPEVT